MRMEPKASVLCEANTERVVEGVMSSSETGGRD
jgi:hypothetical protein